MNDPGRVGIDRAGRTPLHYAALQGDLDAAVRLIDDGADPNAADSAGMTPLHFAAQAGSVAVARLLLDRGADPRAEDGHGNSPLWTAVFNSRGEGEMITLLRQRGADHLHANQYGQTPLDLARLIGNYPVAKWFDDEPPADDA